MGNKCIGFNEDAKNPLWKLGIIRKVDGHNLSEEKDIDLTPDDIAPSDSDKKQLNDLTKVTTVNVNNVCLMVTAKFKNFQSSSKWAYAWQDVQIVVTLCEVAPLEKN